VIASFPLSRRKHCELDGEGVKRTGSEPNWFQEKTHALVARIQTMLYQRLRKERPHRRLLKGKVMVYLEVNSGFGPAKRTIEDDS